MDWFYGVSEASWGPLGRLLKGPAGGSTRALIFLETPEEAVEGVPGRSALLKLDQETSKASKRTCGAPGGNKKWDVSSGCTTFEVGSRAIEVVQEKACRLRRPLNLGCLERFCHF